MGDIIVRIKPKHIERIIFSIVILLLIGVIFYMVGVRPITLDQPITEEPAVKEQPAAESTEKTNTVPTTEPTAKPTEKTNTTSTVKPKKEAGGEITSGKVTIKRNDYYFDVKSDLKDTSWGKLQSVDVTIENGESTAIEKPELQIYFYDDEDAPQSKINYKVCDGLKKIPKETSVSIRCTPGSTVNDLDLIKTLKFRLYDGDTLVLNHVETLDVSP